VAARSRHGGRARLHGRRVIPWNTATAAQQLAPSRRHAWPPLRAGGTRGVHRVGGMLFPPGIWFAGGAAAADSSSAGKRDEALCRLSVQPGAHFTLWYFHGNAEDLGDLAPRLQALRQLGFAVFAHRNTPAMALSGGTPTEASIRASAETGFQYLRDELRKSPATARALRPLARRRARRRNWHAVSPWRGSCWRARLRVPIG